MGSSPLSRVPFFIHWPLPGKGNIQSIAADRSTAYGNRFPRAKRLNEGFMEVIAVREVLDGILIGFTQQAFADEVKDNVPEVDAFIDTPLGENALGYRPKFLEGIFAHTVEQLLPADMAGRVELAHGVVKPIADEKVGFEHVARILSKDRGK